MASENGEDGRTAKECHCWMASLNDPVDELVRVELVLRGALLNGWRQLSRAYRQDVERHDGCRVHEVADRELEVVVHVALVEHVVPVPVDRARLAELLEGVARLQDVVLANIRINWRVRLQAGLAHGALDGGDRLV